MTNTKGEGQGGDPFWDKAERLLLASLIAYLHYEAPVEEQNFATLLEMLNTMQVAGGRRGTTRTRWTCCLRNWQKRSPTALPGGSTNFISWLPERPQNPSSFPAVRRLAPFDIQELRDLTMYDELQLDTLGDKKTALFLIMSDTDDTFNFLIIDGLHPAFQSAVRQGRR